MKKVLYGILGVAAVLIIGIGSYVYSVYSSISHNISNTIQDVYEPLERDYSDKRNEQVNIDEKQPISMLVLGIDRRENERGRSDSMMLITLNAGEKSMKIVSIPRDTYTDIIGKGKKDKINHAYAFGGADMAVATVEHFLNVPVDYYMEIDMKGFLEIVNAVGGVDVVNDIPFTYGNHTFEEGFIHVDGNQALSFATMRDQDGRGDFGRQLRQREVITGVVRKVMRDTNLARSKELRDAVRQNVKTNLTEDGLFAIQEEYGDCYNNREDIRIEGEGGIASDGIWYYNVSEQTRQAISGQLRNHLDL